jgi:ubiquitin-protein ligase
MSTESSEYINELKSLIIRPLNGRVIRLIKHNDNVSDTIMHLDVDTFPVKVTTDFNKYCMAESALDIFSVNKFNMTMCFKSKNPQQIINELCKVLNTDAESKGKLKFTDSFHIYQKLDEFSKVVIEYKKLEKEFSKIIDQSKGIQQNEKIPKDLLLSPQQISQLIINEVKKVNRNRDYLHYVIPNESNPYILTLRIKFDPETDAGKIFQQINKDFGYDYMELKLTIEPKTHPFIPPKLEYVKPKIKLPLLLSLINLDVLKIDTWSSTITLEYFITNLANQIALVVKDYVIPDAQSNGNPNVSFDELEYELIKLASITKESTMDKIDIKIPVPKKASTDVSAGSKFWKAGTGYGGEGIKEWDIKAYIKEQEVQSNEIAEILGRINKMISHDNIEMVNQSVLMRYVINQIKGFTMLEYEKSKTLYKQIFNILANLIGHPMSQTVINAISMGVKPTWDELEILFKSSKEAMGDETLLQIYCLSDWYVSKYQEPITEIIINTDIKEAYCQAMKKLQFGNYEIPLAHRFSKYKDQKPSQTALMRILSEISSFKKDLPLNWESTIWARVPKSNFHLFSFLISGPKDTPYENGLFEFHGYLPADYPNTVPQVLIHTTGGGKVRFNPNLYDSGKVCLSILGTWSGQAGESWNPKTSTFLQVMVSIQSLILVEQPYFNEPGWEREMHTDKGKLLSTQYSEERMPSTIKFGMTDMIKNPPNGFEEVVKTHFRMKREEIINRTLIWEQKATKYQNAINANRAELIDLLDKL